MASRGRWGGAPAIFEGGPSNKINTWSPATLAAAGGGGSAGNKSALAPLYFSSDTLAQTNRFRLGFGGHVQIQKHLAAHSQGTLGCGECMKNMSYEKIMYRQMYFFMVLFFTPNCTSHFAIRRVVSRGGPVGRWGGCVLV